MKYTWKAISDDGCFEDEAERPFATRREAYEDMRQHALEKMKWNTEWEDFERADPLNEEDLISSFMYEVHFSPNCITHNSYSGKYTYTIVNVADTIVKYGRTWTVIEGYEYTTGDWLVGVFEGVGAVYMNNICGHIVLLEDGGSVLKSDI